MTASPAEVARKVFEAVSNDRFDDFAALLAPTLTLNDRPLTAEQWVEGVKMLKANDPESNIQVVETITEGTRVVARLRSTGRHTSKLFGVYEPTGRTYQSKGVYVFTVVDGLITEAWDVWDFLGQMIELEVWPPS